MRVRFPPQPPNFKNFKIMNKREIIFNNVKLIVYENGDIFTEDRYVTQWNGHINQVRFIKSKKLTPACNGKAGYYQIKVYSEGKGRAEYVHRLVWLAFNGAIPEGYEIDHLDDDKSNNALSNLSVKTRKQNMDKMFAANPDLIYNLKQFKKKLD